MSLKNMIPRYQDYIKRKTEADSALQADFDRAATLYQPEALKGYTEQRTAEHDQKWRGEFDKLSAELTRQLDRMQGDIESKMNTRAEGYDLRLANTLAMLNTLDGAAIKGNREAVIAQTKEFTGDPLARASISAIVSGKAPMLTAEMFDTESEAKLQAINTARRFCNRYGNNEKYICDDLETFCDRHGLE